MLDLLFEGRFADYVSTARRGAKTWLFVHVPKSAGSSLSQELSAELKPYYNIHIDHADSAKPGPERFDAAVENFLAKAATTKFQCVSGHILQRHVQAIRRALPGVRAVTLLREPLSRLISDYNYQRSPAHPLHREVAERAPDFMTFAEQPGPQNRMSRHLVPMSMIRQNRTEDAIAHVMRSVAFVGVQERYDLYFRLLSLIAIGHVKTPVEKRRVAEKPQQPDLTADQMARIRELNAMDFALYDAVAAPLNRVEADLAAWLDGQPTTKR